MTCLTSLSRNSAPLVAGGAPRDWDVGLPATDVDLWVTTTNGHQAAILELMALYDVTPIMTRWDPSYYIQAIYNVEVEDNLIQLIMVTDSSPTEVVGRFCCSLSEAIWLWEDDSIIVSPDYRESRRTKVLRFCTDQTGPQAPSENYLDKMKQKFPDYEIDFYSYLAENGYA